MIEPSEHHKFMHSVIYGGGRRQGKWSGNIAMIKFCLKQRQQIIIGTANQAGLIECLRKEIPDALFELVGVTGVRIHMRKK